MVISAFPPHVAGQDVEFLPVFGHGAAGDGDALFLEFFDQFEVTVDFSGRFVLHQLEQGVLDAGIAEGFAGLGLVAGGEEIFEFVDALGRGGAFAVDGPGDGGLVDADGVGDGRHIEGAQVVPAVKQEVLLMADDFAGDFLDGFLSLIDAADEELAPRILSRM